MRYAFVWVLIAPATITRIPLLDGHNDTVHNILEYIGEAGIDFLAPNAGDHLDLPRAHSGGLFGGFFAMWVPAEHPPENDLTPNETSYAVRVAEPLDPAYAQRETARQLAALKALVARSDGGIRIATDVAEIEQARHDGAFSMLLHMQGAEAIGADMTELDGFHKDGVRSLGPVWSRPNIFGNGVPFAFPSSPDTDPGLTLPAST